jgi:predicted RNA-binding Zn ribbon-like protein
VLAAEMVTCQCGVMDVRGTNGGELRDGFRFRGGHTALDFAATLARRLKSDPRELLAAPEDLARWLVAAGMAESPPEVSAADLVAAHALREAVYALAEAQIHGRAPARQDVATLNRLAGVPAAVPWLDDEGSARWRGDAAALLALLAREAVLLLGGADRARIRQCEAEGCALLFLDMSRAGDRRWCSMQGCGNKAKVAEFRRRRRSGG